MTLSYTPLRHKMLAEVATGEGFDCGPWLILANQKRSIWKPHRLTTAHLAGYSAAESRAMADLFGADITATPEWDHAAKVRALRMTHAGWLLLSSWDAQYGEVKP